MTPTSGDEHDSGSVVRHEVDEIAELRRREMWHAVSAATVVLISLTVVAMAVVALFASRDALRHAHRTERNLCEGLNNITLRDRQTISNGPAASVPLLRKLGFSEKRIEAFVQAQNAPGGPVQTEKLKRPFFDCQHYARPTQKRQVPFPGTPPPAPTTG